MKRVVAVVLLCTASLSAQTLRNSDMPGMSGKQMTMPETTILAGADLADVAIARQLFLLSANFSGDDAGMQGVRASMQHMYFADNPQAIALLGRYRRDFDTLIAASNTAILKNAVFPNADQDALLASVDSLTNSYLTQISAAMGAAALAKGMAYARGNTTQRAEKTTVNGTAKSLAAVSGGGSNYGYTSTFTLVTNNTATYLAAVTTGISSMQYTGSCQYTCGPNGQQCTIPGCPPYHNINHVLYIGSTGGSTNVESGPAPIYFNAQNQISNATWRQRLTITASSNFGCTMIGNNPIASAFGNGSGSPDNSAILFITQAENLSLLLFPSGQNAPNCNSLSGGTSSGACWLDRTGSVLHISSGACQALSTGLRDMLPDPTEQS